MASGRAVRDVVAVDWSGARSRAGRTMWLAHARDGILVSLRNGLDRAAVVHAVQDLAAGAEGGVVAGLDFAFSLPAWFLETRGYTEVGELWAAAAAEGEQWLAACSPPFWGRPGRRRPVLPAHLRRCEESARVGGIAAKSAFQIGGAGSVGTGSIRGMPYLSALRAVGFAVWPFDPPGDHTVVEIYPRLLTGRVRKRNPEARAQYVARGTWALSRAQLDAVGASEDAFDAAISALAMAARVDELGQLSPTTDPVALLEGDIWPPPGAAGAAAS
ncbi:MAG TPA: DUF429 domain-containing protein [Acidimicrobiales bacterium]|nr:DUF429 domain-containing protein [Acidimicrobiales bacterium]